MLPWQHLTASPASNRASQQPARGAALAAGLNEAPVAARTFRLKKVDGQVARVGVHIVPVGAQGDTPSGSRAAIPSDVLSPAPLMGQPPVELDNDFVIVIDEISANRTTGGKIRHGCPHRWQPMSPEHSPHEIHLQHAFRTIGDNSQGQLKGPSMPVRTPIGELGGEVLDGDAPLLHRPGCHGDRILAGSAGNIAEVDHGSLGGGDCEPTPADRPDDPAPTDPHCNRPLSTGCVGHIDLQDRRWPVVDPEDVRRRRQRQCRAVAARQQRRTRPAQPGEVAGMDVINPGVDDTPTPAVESPAHCCGSELLERLGASDDAILSLGKSI